MKAIFLAGAFLVLLETGFAQGVEQRQELSGDTYTSNLHLATRWFKDFVPELRSIIGRGQNSEQAEARKAAQELEKELKNILNNPIYGSGWALRFN